MEWKKNLRDLKLEYLKTHHYDFFVQSGGYRQKLPQYGESTRLQLLTAIYDFLKYSNYFVNRSSKQCETRRVNGKLRAVYFSPPYDLVCVINGQSFKIKVVWPGEEPIMQTIEDGFTHIRVSNMKSFLMWQKEFSAQEEVKAQ